jgi:branched-chain amino acid transport system substrate-binding protein
MKSFKRVGGIGLCVGLVFASPIVFSQQGFTKTTVVFGQSAEFSGQGVAKENTDGAQAYFEYLNKRGGVHGRKIELKSYDDARDNKRTVANTEKLINEDKVFALFGYRSTPSVEVALPVATQAKVPMIAPFSGAQSIREPLNPLVFHLRASYQQEAGKIVEQLTTQGIKKIAILHQDDGFGKDGLAGFEKALKERSISPTVIAKYDRKDLNVTGAVDAIAKTSPQAVVMACTPKACADFVKQTKKLGQQPQFITLSNVTSDEFVKMLAGEGRGVAVTQVVPNPWSTALPLVREFNTVLQDTKKSIDAKVSYSSFEGFISAKLVAEALKRAGPNLSREKFLTALESMKEVDLGGMTVRYSATDHTGSDFVEMTVIGKDGKFRR